MNWFLDGPNILSAPSVALPSVSRILGIILLQNLCSYDTQNGTGTVRIYNYLILAVPFCGPLVREHRFSCNFIPLSYCSQMDLKHWSYLKCRTIQTWVSLTTAFKPDRFNKSSLSQFINIFPFNLIFFSWYWEGNILCCNFPVIKNN